MSGGERVLSQLFSEMVSGCHIKKRTFNYNYYLKMLDNFLDKPTACCRIESEHLGANL